VEGGRELDSRGDCELLEGVAQVGLDTRLCDEQALGDLPVGETLSCQVGDTPLPTPPGS
jgi:hypothetical protein